MTEKVILSYAQNSLRHRMKVIAIVQTGRIVEFNKEKKMKSPFSLLHTQHFCSYTLFSHSHTYNNLNTVVLVVYKARSPTISANETEAVSKIATYCARSELYSAE